MNKNLHFDLRQVTKRIIVVAAFCSLQVSIKAQTWATAFGFGSTSGSELGKGVCMDASGNSYYIGNFGMTVDFDPTAGVNNLTSAGITDVVITKYSPAGVYQWAVKGGGTSTDAGNGIATDGTNVYITGTFTTS